MPTPTKRSTGPIPRQKPIPEQLQATFRRTANELVALAKQAKRRFDQLDTTSKRKVIAGLSGLAALLALRAQRRRAKHRREKNKRG